MLPERMQQLPKQLWHRRRTPWLAQRLGARRMVRAHRAAECLWKRLQPTSTRQKVMTTRTEQPTLQGTLLCALPRVP